MTARAKRHSGQGQLLLPIKGGILPATIPQESAEPTPTPTEAEIYEAFYEWWDGYPRRVAIKRARAAFARIMRDGEATIAQLTAGRDRYVEECRRRGTQPHYIAHPASWLNAGRWLDERDAPYSAATASFARIGAEFRAKAGR